MICPHCHKKVDDAETFCPYCHGYLGSDAPQGEFIFCEGCGARLSSRDRCCPKCGRPAPGILSSEASASDLAAGKTASFPKLSTDAVEADRIPAPTAAGVLDGSLDPESTHILTMPQEQEKPKRAPRPGEDPYHAPKRRWGLAVATVCALAAVGGGAYFVTQDPLGVMPGFYASIKASAAEMFPSRYPAQTAPAQDAAPEEEQASSDGPVEVEDQQVLTGDAAYEALIAVYEEIGAYEDTIADVVDDYNESFIASSLERRQSASQSAYAMREQVQATLDKIAGITLEQNSPYAEDLEHITSLATWMYNRVDVLCDSWDISLGYPDGSDVADHQSEISAPLRDALNAEGRNENLVQYEDHYAEWEPVRR